jgi:hypothetical protein
MRKRVSLLLLLLMAGVVVLVQGGKAARRQGRARVHSTADVDVRWDWMDGGAKMTHVGNPGSAPVDSNKAAGSAISCSMYACMYLIL